MFTTPMALLLTYSVALAAPAASWTTIGTGRSQAHLTDVETVLFEHNATKGAVMNHFWAAGSPSVDNTTFRYYVDGESSASIVFTPALACGVGCAPLTGPRTPAQPHVHAHSEVATVPGVPVVGDQTAPWGTKWLGKGAKSTGWFHNIQVPFKSLRVTYQKNAREPDGTIWMILRGLDAVPEATATDTALRIGSLELPWEARLQLQV